MSKLVLEKNHLDKEWITQKFVVEGLKAQEIADLCGVTRGAVYGALDKFGIERKKATAKIYHDEEWLREIYEEKRLTSSEIAKLCGAAPRTICHFLNKFGIKTRDIKAPRAIYKNREWLYEKYVMEGQTIEEMARVFGISKSVICYHMNKHGIQRKTSAEGRRGKPQTPAQAKASKKHSEWMMGRRFSLGTIPDEETRQKMRKSHYRKDISREQQLSNERFRKLHQAELNHWTYQVLGAKDIWCDICGKETRRAHHLEELAINFDLAFDPDNGIPMCQSCHQRFHQWARWRVIRSATKVLYEKWKELGMPSSRDFLPEEFLVEMYNIED